MSSRVLDVVVDIWCIVFTTTLQVLFLTFIHDLSLLVSLTFVLADTSKTIS